MISTRLLRRLWILPVSIVLVAAIAYAVAGVQSSTYTATSTVVVSSVPGAVSASNSAGAGALANTYAGALPSDGALQAYVTRTAHVPATDAIKANPPRGSAITFTFTAPTRAGAIAGGRALARGLTAAKPVSSTVSAGTLHLVQSPTTATATVTGRYRAKVVVLVPASGGPTEGLNPSDAGHLATTYAAIIPADDKLLLAASHAIGLPVSQVASDLSVVNEQNTSLLQIGFKASSSHDANAGARAVAKLVSGPNPVARGIIPSSIQDVSLPAVIPSDTPVSSGGGSSKKPIVIGGVIGLLLGIVLLVGWERSDPRISDARGLSSVLGCPATPADRLSPDAAYALLERWRSLTDQVPARVAILPADNASVQHADAVIDALIAGGHGDVSFVDARSGELPERLGHDAATDAPVPISLISAAVPGEGGAGEAVALGCDLAVVVVRDGARAANIRRLGDELGNFGVVPAWALLSSRATLKHASARHETTRHAVSA
jgi:capsular polysaccharide biosynthesis protein